MDYEVYTTGGGWFLFNFFNAVAAIAQAPAFREAITAATLTGMAWLLITIAFQQKWNTVGSWLAISSIAVYGFLSPVSEVRIMDNINRVETSGYVVDNVPFGLAAFAGLTSQVGHNLTQMFEQNFADPDTPTLTENGFLFGVKLLAEATRMEVKDNYLERSLSSYIRNCVFYDILNGRKNMEDLKTAADPWDWITDDPPVALMFEFFEDGQPSEVVTCADGLADLDRLMTASLRDAENRLAATMTSDRSTMSRDAIRAIITNELGSFHEYLVGASRTSTEIMRRQMTINALMREPANWMADMGNEAALRDYMDTRMDIQTRLSYESTGRQAAKWLPLLKVVMQALLIGCFPIAVLLMITPIGGVVIRNFIYCLIWVESWAPLYAILNYMVNSKARTQMQSVLEASGGGDDITLFAQAGIQAVEQSISAQAGYLAMSVPFIALALASGVGRFAMLATSTLAVSQEAVSSTSQEATTGNLSLGNTSYDNHSMHNYSGFNHNTSMQWDSGRSSGYDDGGALITQAADGKIIADIMAGQSRTPMGINIGTAMEQRYTQAATEYRALAQGEATRISNLEQAAQSDTATFANSVMQGRGTDFAYGTEQRGSFQKDAHTVVEAARSLTKGDSEKTEEAVRAMAAASVVVSSPDFWVKGSLEAKAAYEAMANSTISYEDALKAIESEKVSTAINNLTSASSGEHAKWNDGENTSIGDAMEARFTEMRSSEQSRNISLEKAERFEHAASVAESVKGDTNHAVNQAWFEYVADKVGAYKAVSLLGSTDKADIAKVQDYAQGFLADAMEGKIDGISPNDLAGRYDSGAAEMRDGANIRGKADAMQEGIDPENQAAKIRGRLDADGERIKRESGDLRGKATAGVQSTEARVGEARDGLEKEVTGEGERNKTGRVKDTILQRDEPAVGKNLFPMGQKQGGDGK